MKTISHKKIVYYDTDLFDDILSLASDTHTEKDIIVPNVSNIDPNTMTSFQKRAMQIYPAIQDNIDVQKHNLGQNCFIKVYRKNNNNIYFCQMFSDKNNKLKNINYIHLVNCMIGVRNFCFDIKGKEEKQVEIHCPKFGTGVSGGKWPTIADLITDCWNGIPTFVYRKN